MLLLLYIVLIFTPSLGSEPVLECSADFQNHEFLKIKNQLDEANVIIQNLIESNRKLRMELQTSRKTEENSQKPSALPSAPKSTASINEIAREFESNGIEGEGIVVNGWNDDVDTSTEFVYGLPQGDEQRRRKIVIELGANNGEWIRGFLASNPDYWPLIVEPQPMYRDILREIAIEVAASRSNCRCGQCHHSAFSPTYPARAAAPRHLPAEGGVDRGHDADLPRAHGRGGHGVLPLRRFRLRSRLLRRPARLPPQLRRALPGPRTPRPSQCNRAMRAALAALVGMPAAGARVADPAARRR
jgi:hypothetical protein